MDAQNIVKNWLQALSAELAIEPLTLDEKGVGAFDYKNKVRLVIEVPKSSPLVFLHAPLAPRPLTGIEAFYEKLLKHNFLMQETNGATFAINDQTGTVSLCFTCPVAQLDQQAFVNLLGSFLETVDKWQSRLNRYEQKENGETAEDKKEFPPEGGKWVKV